MNKKYVLRRSAISLSVALLSLACVNMVSAQERVYLQGGALIRPVGTHSLNDAAAGIGWALPWQWSEGRLRTRLDLSVGYTHTKADEVVRFQATPVLRYQANNRGFFAEIGTGLTYLSSSRWGRNHDLGGRFHFGSRLGLGFDFGKYDVSLNITHFSNAGLKDENPGAEVLGIRYSHAL